MNYPLNEKYSTPELLAKIMGPNPMKLEEELLIGHHIPEGSMVGRSRDAEIIEVSQMESDEEVWDDWLRQENEYAVGDRKAMEAGGGKYLNFIKIVLRKK